jgi:hypothetical protein
MTQALGGTLVLGWVTWAADGLFPLWDPAATLPRAGSFGKTAASWPFFRWINWK